MFGRMSVICLAFVAFVLARFAIKTKFAYPEIGYTVSQLVESNGYPFEYHNLTTSDGYILEIHRIPHGKDEEKSDQVRPVIFVMHGLLGSSECFLTTTSKSLPFYLADRGYDVWLGNARGNFYSRKHETIDPDENPKEFFDFSWHEIGSIDVPSMIDYVLGQTHHEKLFYLGHSQGTVSFYVMMSQKPEYNQKVDLMLAFAPVVHLKEIKSLAFRLPAALQGLVEWLSELIGYYELFPRNDYWKNFGNYFCSDGAWTQVFCEIPIGLTGGFNTPQLNKTLFPLIYYHMPAGASVKQLFHYTQILNSDVFRQYDHGEVGNLEKYGQRSPPEYKLDNTKVPVSIYYGNNDWITSERDIDVLFNALPNVVQKFKVPDESFTHFDFLLSNHAIDILYPNVYELMEKYRKSSIRKSEDSKISKESKQHTKET